MSITPQISKTLANLNGVAFPDKSHGWAEGAIEKGDGTRVGIIVATSDGGATWTEVLETTMQLRDIAFPDILHGWAVGGDPPTILATVDGGGAWRPQTSGIEDDLVALFTATAFPDSQNGWIVGAGSNGGIILATADGGATWRRQAQDAVNFADDFRGVAFPDTQHGWAVGGASPEGGSLIIATSNGGETWERQTPPVTNHMGITYVLFGIAFADINHGLAVGDNGTILATADGGRTWTSRRSNTDARLFRVAFPDVNHGWAVGQAKEGGGVILVTDDGGGTWTPQIPEAGQPLLGVAFPDIRHGWLVGGSGTILAVMNGRSTVTALQPFEGHVDLFTITPNGTVRSTFFDVEGEWREWFPIPPILRWGRLANPGFEGQRIKTTLFFAGQANDGSRRQFPDGTEDCLIFPNLDKYTLNPEPDIHLNWTNPANRDIVLNLMTNAGINVISMSSWGEDFLPCTDGWVTGSAPMQTSAHAHDELFDAAVNKPVLIVPFIESRATWTMRDEFPRWSDGRVSPGLVSQIVNLIQRYLKNPTHPEWADVWATVYDRNGMPRHAVVLIHACSNNLGPFDDAAFAEGFDLVANEIALATGIQIGFFIDAVPPDATLARASFKPSFELTGPFLLSTASFLGIQCFGPEIFTGESGDDDLLAWKRNFIGDWFSTSIPVLVDVSPGYDGHLVFMDEGKAPYGHSDEWIQGMTVLVNDYGRAGMVYNSWNGYTEAMVGTPTREKGNTLYDWLKSLNGIRLVPLRAQPGATVTALLPFEGHVDLFTTAPDGTVISILFEAHGGWRDWFPIRPETRMASGATVTALQPFEGHVDLFATTDDGRVMTIFFADGEWQKDWFPIRPETRIASGATITALQPFEGHVDLFATTDDGRVMTIFFADGEWQKDWFPIRPETRMASGATVTALQPFEGHVDLFATTDDGRVMTIFFADGEWQKDWFPIRPETRMASGATVTALQPFEGHVDLFATTDDGRVMTIFFADGEWQKDWFPIRPETRMASGATVTALQPFEGHVDLFAITTNGTVMSTFFEAGQWRGWFPIP